MDILDENQWRRVQALTDFNEALSALTFFMEMPERTNRIERKRYRCYHDTAIISYCRPFTKSNGLPILSRKSVRKDTLPEEKQLHALLMDERNKVVAHTDADRMRLLLTSFDVLDGIRFPHIVKDEGFALIGNERQFEAWLHKLTASLATEVFEMMQVHEPGVEFRQDYLHDDLSTRPPT
nr:hypothetical protein [Polymorphobacter sp.]